MPLRWNQLPGGDGRLVVNGHALPCCQQQLDGIGDVLFRDVMITPLDAK
jgi:hypothetical protein